MDPQGNRSWPLSGPPTSGPEPGREPLAPMQQRPHQSYGQHPSGHGPPSQIPGPPSLPPPTAQGSYYGQQQSGTSLPSLSGLAPASSPPPPQSAPPPPHQRSSPLSHHQGPPSRPSQSAQGYSLPGINQAMHQSSGVDRERQMYEAEMRAADDRNRQQQESRDHMRLAEQQRSPTIHGGAVPLRQPVASRPTGLLHGPNGILAPHADVGGLGSLPAPQNHHRMAYSSANALGHESPRQYAAQGISRENSDVQMSQAPPVSAPATAPQQSGQASSIPQGQQPILNDALTYLDQVKMRFSAQPDVYNKFLDIMKDFKSQAIDTPGVINRVSALFSGHPKLIQGFNTFLPSGYKIEAGWGNDPNNIRVYTPLGSHEANTASMSFHGGNDVHPDSRQVQELGYRSDLRYGDPMREDGPGSSSDAHRAYEAHYRSRQEQLDQEQLHQQEQQGVSQLQSAANAAASQQNRLAAMQQGGVMGNLGAMGMNGSSMPTIGQQLNMEKRGPVEFNHAISYVNKIKTRFHQQPEIYKQFLDILQTYQRESKPIQDVYAQVTQLFSAAPDLLEDFKQFLPESTAQAKAQAAARQATEEVAVLSNVRGDPNYIAGISNLQAHTPKPDKMPPIGNFAPPSSITKDGSKKRRGGPGAPIAMGTSQDGAGRGTIQGGGPAKRTKTAAQNKAPAVELISVQSPTLVPELPHPLPPTTSSAGSVDEIAFFDRVKKYVANKQTYNEFLKLCNIFGQDMIDKNTLVERAEGFIGQNADLIGYFKRLVGYTGRDEVIDNKPVPNDNRVALSLCRALGPSYRLLPRRERFAKCSGRDEMCFSVLNDEWASHPTWASEDSGFVAHRKNMFEEALHRMEEERHDYDFNIETTLRTIQLLEPIVQQISLMTTEEKKAYRLPGGLGGQSEAIWQRVIKKIYDRSVGCRIVEDMLNKPARVAPFLLMRLKEKVEVWKQAQREWEKIWREQTHKQFWKSLDHQGLNAKADNKRMFQPKTLQTDIQAKYEEQVRLRETKGPRTVPKHQLYYGFADFDVIADASHILLTYIHSPSYGNTDAAKVDDFIKTFVPSFFGLDKEIFVAHMSDIYTESPRNEDEDEEDSAAGEESTTQRGQRSGPGRQNLLRGVLDPRQSRAEDSNESTPAAVSADDEAGAASDSQSEKVSRTDPSQDRWLDHPVTEASRGIRLNELFPRDRFNLYAPLNLYCFFRVFQMLYQRLCHIKQSEAAVRADVARASLNKPAAELRMSEKPPAEFFEDVSGATSYYKQTLAMCENVLKRNSDMTKLEEILRRFYLARGWQLYSFDKMVAAIVKFAGQALGNDSKDHGQEIVNLFLENRKEVETTHQTEINFRKQVEKLAKEGDLYRIIYNQTTKQVMISIFKKDDMTFDVEDMSNDFLYSYYITSYQMIDRTEGVPEEINLPFLRRNHPHNPDATERDPSFDLPQAWSEGLQIRIVPGSFRILYEVNTTDAFVHSRKMRSRGINGMAALQRERKARFEDKFVLQPKWMQGLSAEEIDGAKLAYDKLVSGEEPETVVVEQQQQQQQETPQSQPAVAAA